MAAAKAAFLAARVSSPMAARAPIEAKPVIVRDFFGRVVAAPSAPVAEVEQKTVLVEAAAPAKVWFRFNEVRVYLKALLVFDLPIVGYLGIYPVLDKSPFGHAKS